MREAWKQLHATPDRRGYVARNHGPTGTPGVRWHFDYDRPVVAAPVVGEERVYAAAEDGTLFALDRADGAVLWAFDTGTRAPGPPVLYGGLAFVMNGEGTLFAVTAADGERVWTRDVGSAVATAPAVCDGTLYVSGRDAPLYALDPADGGTRWTQSTVTADGSPTVADDVVVVATGMETFACDAKTGECRWQRDLGDTELGAPAVVAGDRVYVNCEDDNLRALDVDTGETLWAVDCSHWDYYATLGWAPVVDDDRVYVGYFPREVAAVDADTGERLWERSILDVNTVSVALTAATAESLYAVVRDDGRVLRLDPRSGDVHWTVEVPNDAVTSPAVADGTVFVGCHRGGLCALSVE